jgi:hypothetical protein
MEQPAASVVASLRVALAAPPGGHRVTDGGRPNLKTERPSLWCARTADHGAIISNSFSIF